MAAARIQLLADKLSASASKTIFQFEKLLKTDGLIDGATDIASYYKAPMMFLSADKVECAKRILSYIKSRFLMSNGDFKTSNDIKSIKPEYIEYYTYMNSWIIRAANLLGDDSLKLSAFSFIKKFYYEDGNFFLTNSKCPQSDVLTVAHQGLLNLEMGDLAPARAAGNTLIEVLKQQHSLDDGFHLRFNETKKLIIDFSADSALFHLVSTKKPTQLYFMIGYPCAYLAKLYQTTREEKYLVGAKDYFDFALKCGDNIYTSTFSHKLAWAASLLFQLTGEEKYLSVIERITNYFISLQDENGIWLASEGPSTSLDQSAEIACWFMDIKKNMQKHAQ